jgi:hypothetical protein
MLRSILSAEVISIAVAVDPASLIPSGMVQLTLAIYVVELMG